MKIFFLFLRDEAPLALGIFSVSSSSLDYPWLLPPHRRNSVSRETERNTNSFPKETQPDFAFFFLRSFSVEKKNGLPHEIFLRTSVATSNPKS
ncbi:MAG: hypothetical protein D6679_06825 [Candidatus Hydrogenedentota bacterium]|nr:MAG: hypothetical protein D6679_06825 [Candidatus Hydrogenedentota bacterium]